MSHEIVTWAKMKGWMLNQLSHPGTPSRGRILVCLHCRELWSHSSLGRVDLPISWVTTARAESPHLLLPPHLPPLYLIS